MVRVALSAAVPPEPVHDRFTVHDTEVEMACVPDVFGVGLKKHEGGYWGVQVVTLLDDQLSVTG